MERLLRAGFMCALFAGLFGTGHWRLHTTRRVHIIVLRLLGCQVQHLPCKSQIVPVKKGSAFGWT